MRVFSALTGSYPKLGVLSTQREVWDHTAELHVLYGYIIEGITVITFTPQVPQLQSLASTGIIIIITTV